MVAAEPTAVTGNVLIGLDEGMAVALRICLTAALFDRPRLLCQLHY
jgi:hypothetical protein